MSKRFYPEDNTSFPPKRLCQRHPTHILSLRVDSNGAQHNIQQLLNDTVSVQGYASCFEEFWDIDLLFKLEPDFLELNCIYYTFYSVYSSVYVQTLLSRHLDKFVKGKISINIEGIYRLF